MEQKQSINQSLRTAFGQILLIIIGILIALSIFNWNQSRKNQMLARTYLKSIQQEIIRNDKENQTILALRMPQKIESLNLAKQYCEKQKTIQDTLAFLNKIAYSGVFSGGYDFGLSSAYNELMSTGNIQHIMSDTLKNAIADYYTYMEIAKERASIHASDFSSFTSQLRPYDRKNASFISKYDQNEMMTAFKTSEFRKLVDLELSYAHNIRDYINRMQLKSEFCLQLIDQNLDF